MMKWAVGIMKDRDIAAIPLDKEVGMCIISNHNLREVHRDILSKPCYSPMHVDTEEEAILDFNLSARAIAKRIAVLERDPGLQSQLLRSTRIQGWSYDSKLRLTCKSHKPNGSIEFRNIHACASPANYGISSWVSAELRKGPCRARCVIRSSTELVSMLAGQYVDDDDVLLRIDVKHFYMSGTRQQLVQASTKHLDTGPRKACVSEAIDMLLKYQFVSSDVLGTSHWVREGSGMGLGFSDPIASTSFANSCEEWVLRPSTKVAFGIKLYARYVDDIFMLINRRSRLRQLCYCMQERAHPIFQLECVQISGTSSGQRVDMLDLHIFREGHRLHWRPIIKSGGMPLTVSSAHAAAVHASWPVSVMRSLSSRCSKDDDLRIAQAALLDRFRDSLAPKWLLDRLVRCMNEPVACKPKVANNRVDLWCPIGWHPCWHNAGIEKVLLEFNRDPILSRLYCFSFEKAFSPPRVRLAWKSELPVFQHWLYNQTVERSGRRKG